MMKKRYPLLILLILSLLILSGCAGKNAAEPEAAANVDLTEPAASSVTNSEDRIPLLPEAADLAALLPQKDTVRLEIGMYHDAFTVENADGLGFSVEKGQIKENAVKAEEGASTIEEIVSTTYRVPFAEAYRLSYDEPQENCNFKVSWSDGAAFARAEGSGIQTVECSLSGIRLTGENMRFTLKYFAENGAQELLKITGAEESAVCLIRTADGFRFYCGNGAHMELPDHDELHAVCALEIPAGTVGVLEHASEGYDAALYTEPFPE